jgi:hypothetical protein
VEGEVVVLVGVGHGGGRGAGMGGAKAVERRGWGGRWIVGREKLEVEGGRTPEVRRARLGLDLRVQHRAASSPPAPALIPSPRSQIRIEIAEAQTPRASSRTTPNKPEHTSRFASSSGRPPPRWNGAPFSYANIPVGHRESRRQTPSKAPNAQITFDRDDATEEL